MNNTTNSIYVSFDGIIGAGKTTLVQAFKKFSSLNKTYNIFIITICFMN